MTSKDDSSPLVAAHDPNNVVDALRSILGNADVCGVRLKGCDGIEVPSSRCVLAGWLPVFHKMLFGDFVEASLDVIDVVDCDSNVIRKSAEFCYTNEIQEIEKKQEENEDNESFLENLDDTDTTFIQEMVSLANAAHCCQIKKLEEHVKQFLKAVMTNSPWVASYLFEFNSNNDEVHGMSLHAVRCFPEEVMRCELGIKCLSLESLGKASQDPKTHASELFLFDCLQRWVRINMQQDEYGEFDSSEKDALATLSRHVKLQRIDPTKPVAVAKSSKLFKRKRMFFKPTNINLRRYFHCLQRRHQNSFSLTLTSLESCLGLDLQVL